MTRLSRQEPTHAGGSKARYTAVPPAGDHGDGPALKAVVTSARDTGGTFAEGTVSTAVRLDIHAD
ncbi:hypothetical protein [Streptomyces sp. NPDC002516]